MLFSVYKQATVGLWIAVTGIVGLIFFVTLGSFAGAFFLVVMVVLGLIFIPLNFYLIEGRLDDYGGRYPMPNFGLGMLGVDIVDDAVVGKGPRSGVNTVPGQPWVESGVPNEDRDLMPCPFCGHPIDPASVVCEACGQRIIH